MWHHANDSVSDGEFDAPQTIEKAEASLRLTRYAGHFASLVSLFGIRGALRFSAQWALGSPLISARVQELGRDVLIRRFDSDINVLLQILVDRECEQSLPFEPRFIVDAGAYTGYSALFFAHRYPNARIVAIEPNQANFDLLRQNCADLPNITPVHGALWYRQEQLDLGNQGDASWTFQVRPAAAEGAGLVRGYSVDELMRSFEAPEIDILKIDIEGAEREVFTMGERGWLDATRSMIIETHGPECERALNDVASTRNFSVSQTGEKWQLLRGTG